MSNKELKKYLKQSLRQETELEELIHIKLEKTVKLCTEIMREQKLAKQSH